MKFLDLVNTANRNLTRSKLRTTLTILAIFVGGFTLTLTSALSAGVNDYLNRQLGSVTTLIGHLKERVSILLSPSII